jgi:2-hydroxychromene-2-carboxylate isomerase
MTQTTFEFFYDIGSPYSYMASTQIEAAAAKHGARLVWRPFLLGAVFKGAGNSMPGLVPAKAQWMLSDLQNWASIYGVPFVFSFDTFPPNTLRAMRACVAAEAHGKTAALSGALFRAYWVAGMDLSDPHTLREACKVVDLDGDELLAAIETQEVKDGLKRNTDEAVARGAFGAPTIYVDRDALMLVGNDRFTVLDWFMERRKAQGT